MYASYVDARGNRIRRSTGCKDYRQAAALEGKWRAEVHQQKHWDQSPRYTFEDLLVAYMKATTEKRSRERDVYSIKALRPYFGGMAIADIRAEHVSEYKTARRKTVAASTLSKEMNLFSAAINFANAEWDWDLPNPMTGRIPTQPEGRVRWITLDESESLIQAASKRRRAPYLADMIRLALHTGLRHRELLNLEWRRVDLENRLIYLYSEDQKGRRTSSVPINEAAMDALKNRAGIHKELVFTYQGSRIGSAKKSFAKACDQASMRDFRIHDLRHTTASWMVQRGVPLAAVKEVMRHKSIQTTMRYAHLAPENTRAAVHALDWDSFGTLSRKTPATRVKTCPNCHHEVIINN